MQKTTYSDWCSFAFHPPSSLRLCGRVLLALVWLALSAARAQTTNYVLGTTALLVGPAAGTNSVALAVTPTNGTWTAATSAAWLHLSPANQSGSGSTNVIFSYDDNPGATRSGTITIGGQTLTVTQAGSNYIPAGTPTLLGPLTNSSFRGVAVDPSGNIYFTFGSSIGEWTPTNNSVSVLVSSGLSFPLGLALDDGGNIYIADTGDNAIKEWTVANSNLTTLVSSNLSSPNSVALDRRGNVYFATGGNLIQEFEVATSN